MGTHVHFTYTKRDENTVNALGKPLVTYACKD